MTSITHGDLRVNRSLVPSGRGDQCVHPSEQLLSANELLLARRNALQADQHDGPTRSADADTKQLPSHLGWASAALSAIAQSKTSRDTDSPTDAPYQLAVEKTPRTVTKRSTIKVYPSLLTAMLRQEVAAIGRIWLLCHALDQAGQGWLSVDQLRVELTDKTSDWRIVGWRRLRQLLQQGRGVLWERDSFGRIWLYGAARVAKNLNVSRLQGNPVNLPIEKLLSGIQDTKAAFYATFHTGRRTANPISRSTLRELTGSSETTQRTYEASGNITATKNFCVSNIRHTPENIQAEAYKRPTVFAVTDRKTGQQHIAWPLPNNYQTTLQTACRGRQRKINRQLKLSSDLVIQGRGGTGEDFGRIFCANGQQALQQSSKNELFWQITVGKWSQLPT